MQQRRYRPGDVLDDYCPRERRITDHAIVAMIDDRIKQTRCCVCDADHEYKDGKVPPQRRKKPQAALFTQVLDGLQGPQPAARLAHHPDDADEAIDDGEEFDEQPAVPAIAPALELVAQVTVTDAVLPIPPVLLQPVIDASGEVHPLREDGPVRRPLIRATLPRPEGQPLQPTRAMPEFTIRQPTNGRGGHRPAGPGGGRRHGGGASQAPPGPMRFGRSDRGPGNGHGNGNGHGPGPRQHGGRSQGPGQGQGNGGRPGGSRRGGKKQR